MTNDNGNNDSGDFQFHIRLLFSPEWDHVEMLRTSVLCCISTLFRDQDYCEGLSMTVAELLENAVRYGNWTLGPQKGSFELRVVGDKNRSVVEVENPVFSDAENVAKLRAIIQPMKDSTSQRHAYLSRMMQLADSPDIESGESGLGLLRIAFETGAKLEMDLVKGPRLVVRATIESPSTVETTP